MKTRTGNMIGLEIHMYPKTESKMFCSCKASLADDVNTNICPICMGQPGSKPMGINRKAFETALKLAKALKCKIIVDKKIFMQRKHYFYPDAPNNYQRTSEPIGVSGNFKGIRITELHIEEDPGQYELKKGEVDYNRSGFPLVEIVTEPDMKTPEEAFEFLNSLKEVIDYLEVGREGFKVDTNISTIYDDNGKPFYGERVEVKNVNSIDNVKRALEYELERQTKEYGVRETRHFDEMFGTTITLREKETIADYRYMPDPDVPPMLIRQEMIDATKMPEELYSLRERLVKQYGIDAEAAKVLTSEQALVSLYEKLAPVNAVFVADWLRKDLKGELNYRGKSVREAQLDVAQIEKLLVETSSEKIPRLKAKDILRDYLDGKKQIAESIAGAAPTVDLGKITEEAISENADLVEKYKSGKIVVINALIGAVSKKANKAFDANTIREELIKKLS